MRRQRNLLGPEGKGGMVGLWGSPSLLRSMQEDSRNMQSATTANQTITEVNTANTILTHRGVDNTGNDALSFCLSYIELTSSTNVAITRYQGGGGTLNTVFNVVQFNPGVIRSIQSGLITITSGNLTNTATINPVNAAKCFVMLLGQLSQSEISLSASAFTKVALSGSNPITAIIATRGNNNNLTTVSFQVVEFF